MAHAVSVEWERNELVRELEHYQRVVDPLARRVLASDDPWEAYNIALEIAGAVADGMDWLPHGGQVYTQWAELTDLFDSPKLRHVAPEEAQKALSLAASDWLARSAGPSNYLAEWAATDFWLRAWGRPLRAN